MGDQLVNQILAKPILLADQVVKSADAATTSKQECAELKSKAEKLAGLLRTAARASSDLYERPTRRIIDETVQVLEKAVSIVNKCGENGVLMRLFTMVPANAFRKMSGQLENSIGDVSWLLRVSVKANDDEDAYLGLPPIAANEPILGLIWEQVAILITGSMEDRSDAAASLGSLARDNPRYGKLIMEEGGVGYLVKLLKEGKLEGQENAARAIGLLARDAETVEYMIQAGVCQVFAKILKEGSMKVQAVVAWAVSELARNHPKCQDLFFQNNVIRLLVTHLAFETIQEHSKYTIVSTNKPTSMQHAVLLASKNKIATEIDIGDDHDQVLISHPIENQTPNQMHNVITNVMGFKSSGPDPSKRVEHSDKINSQIGMKSYSHLHQSQNGSIARGRELEDPATKSYLKAMAARALWQLARGNSPICHSITESRALLCFAVLMVKGDDDVQYNSAMAVMEITSVAEQDSNLRHSAFKPNSLACKAVVDELLRIVQNADSDLLVPCVRSLGNLARTFRATETRIIGPLVVLLDVEDAEVSGEAATALVKFAETQNYLHKDHSKAIIEAGGAKSLVQLAYFGEPVAQTPALILLSYVSLHVPDSEQLAQDEVLTVLERASKQSNITQDEDLHDLVTEAKSKLELYQSRGSRGFY